MSFLKSEKGQRLIFIDVSFSPLPQFNHSSSSSSSASLYAAVSLLGTRQPDRQHQYSTALGRESLSARTRSPNLTAAAAIQTPSLYRTRKSLATNACQHATSSFQLSSTPSAACNEFTSVGAWRFAVRLREWEVLPYVQSGKVYVPM